MTTAGALSCDQRCLIHSATRVAGSPLAHAQFLPDARSPRVSVLKNGTRVPTRQPRAVASPGRPSRSPLESLAAHRTSRSGGCLPAPARRRFLFPVRTSGSATPRLLHTDGSSWDALFALPRPPVLTHDIAAARPAAIGQGLPDLHHQRGLDPGAGRRRVRCWIQTPRRWQQQSHDR